MLYAVCHSSRHYKPSATSTVMMVGKKRPRAVERPVLARWESRWASASRHSSPRCIAAKSPSKIGLNILLVLLSSMDCCQFSVCTGLSFRIFVVSIEWKHTSSLVPVKYIAPPSKKLADKLELCEFDIEIAFPT